MSLQTIAERLGLTLRVTADGSEIVIRRDGKEHFTGGGRFQWRCPTSRSP